MKAILIVGIIILSLVPVYWINKRLQKIIRPRESARRLLQYMLAGFALVFAYTFLVVFLIKRLFPGA